MVTGLLEFPLPLALPVAAAVALLLELLPLLLQAASASAAAATAATTALRRRYRSGARVDGTAKLLCACSLGGGLAARPVGRVPARLTGIAWWFFRSSAVVSLVRVSSCGVPSHGSPPGLPGCLLRPVAWSRLA